MEKQVEDKVKGIFANLFQVDPTILKAETGQDSIATWDSLRHMNLVSAIESEFDIVLDDSDIADMVSFGLAVEIVRTKKGA